MTKPWEVNCDLCGKMERVIPVGDFHADHKCMDCLEKEFGPQEDCSGCKAALKEAEEHYRFICTNDKGVYRRKAGGGISYGCCICGRSNTWN